MIPYIELKRVAVELTTRCNCLLFGSLGLKMTFPQVLPAPPHDADFFAAGDHDNLMDIISLLRNEGYLVWSWQDPVVDGFDFDALQGRFYFRGVKYIHGFSPAIVDVTYEILGLPYAELEPQTHIVEGIKVLNREGYICSLSHCVKEKHLRECEMLKNL